MSERDNAARESFCGLPPRKVLDRRHWATRVELRLAIVIWIERPTIGADDNAASAA